MGVVVDARPGGDEPCVGDVELLLHEVGVVRHRLQLVECIGLAVVVVAGAEHLAVQPGRIDLVAGRGPPQLRLEFEGIVETAVRAALREELACAETGGIGSQCVEFRLVQEPYQPRPGRIERPGHAFEEREDAVPRIAGGVHGLTSGPEVAHRRGMVDARREGLVEVEVPRQVVRVVAGAGVARRVGDRADGVGTGVAVAETGPQSGAVAEDRADAAVDGLLIEAVGLGQAVLKRAVGSAVGDPELVVDALLGAAEHAQVSAHGPERASLDRAGQSGPAVRRPPLREDLDDGPHRVRSVQRRLRAPHDLDPLDLVGRHAAEVVMAAVGVHAHAVDQHVVVVRFAAAREHRRELAFPSGRLDVQAGHVAQDVGHRVASERLDVVRGEDRVGLHDRRAPFRRP